MINFRKVKKIERGRRKRRRKRLSQSLLQSEVNADSTRSQRSVWRQRLWTITLRLEKEEEEEEGGGQTNLYNILT